MMLHVTRWLVPVCTMAVVACDDDEATQADATSTTSDATTTADTAEVTADIGPTAGCPIGGTWRVQNVVCNEDEDITAEWSSIITRTLVAITPSANGCTMRITLETEDTCKEEETSTLTSKAGDVWTIVSAGIQSCTPDACSFGGQDAACATGDRAKTFDATFQLADGKLRYSSTSGTCADLSPGATTTWVLQPQ